MPASSNRRAKSESEPKHRAEQSRAAGEGTKGQAAQRGREGQGREGQDEQDGEPVQGVNDSQETTSPQPAPAVRPELVSVMSVDSWRAARKATLVSPIPALLAASMGVPPDGAVEGAGNGRMTSRVADGRVRSLEDDSDADYVVEVDPQDDR